MEKDQKSAVTGTGRSRCSVEHSPREVIEGKLLAALDDESKVAALFSKRDLDVLIQGLGCTARLAGPELMQMVNDLTQLRREAFGKQNAPRQDRREATYPERDCSALDSEHVEPEDRVERCDQCGDTRGPLLRGLCPMCCELNGGTHE